MLLECLKAENMEGRVEQRCLTDHTCIKVTPH